MSEFGSGYATCLVQFANHRARLDGQVRLFSTMAVAHPDLPWDAAEVWANGSSDHLYELARPDGLPDDDWAHARTLADRMLGIGHGFPPSTKGSPAECASLLDTADFLLAAIGVSSLDAALEWDRAHGLTPDAGEWSCPEDLVR